LHENGMDFFFYLFNYFLNTTSNVHKFLDF